jgi:histone H3/H4
VRAASALWIRPSKRCASVRLWQARVSGEGLRTVARAAELFLELLAVKSLAVAHAAKRSNFKFADVERAVRGDRRLVSPIDRPRCPSLNLPMLQLGWLWPRARPDT